MKILYIAPYGSRRFLTLNEDQNTSALAGSLKVGYISSGLASEGHEVLIVSSMMTSRSRMQLSKAHYETIPVGRRAVSVYYPGALKLRPWGGLINCLRARNIMMAVTREFKPDVAIIYNTYMFEVFCARWLLSHERVRFWLEVEDLPHARRRDNVNLKPVLDSMCWQWALRNASAFSAVNTPVFELLPSAKRRELLPGVIDSRLVERSCDRVEPFCRTQRRIGYFGGLSESKGVGVLIEALPFLPRNWQMVVTGAGPLTGKFAAASVRNPERLRFEGHVTSERMFELLCDCDVAVVPKEHIQDGGRGVFPFKAFEYIASGVHIIASRLPTISEYKCEFFQRWDGTCARTLMSLLESAPLDYAREKNLRSVLRGNVLDRCSEPSVARLASSIVRSIARP